MLDIMKIDDLGYPEAILACLKKLSEHITFSHSNDKGGNGNVIFGRNNLLEKDVVIKFYYWGNDPGLHAEPGRLAAMDHPAILRILDAAPVDDEWAYFTTPVCQRGDLDDAMESRRFSLHEAIETVQHIAGGVSYLHGQGYVHRDLKPLNILCDSENVYKIADFGSVVAVKDTGEAETKSKHSLLYRPPENINYNVYFKLSDIYQLGVLLYQLLGGRLPYIDVDHLSSKQLIEYKKIPDSRDQQIYCNDCIGAKIESGRLLDFNSLPAWIPSKLITLIRRATNKHHEARFSSCADMIAQLHKIRTKAPPWGVVDSLPTLTYKDRSIRVVSDDNNFYVEKRKSAGWRTQKSAGKLTFPQAIDLAETL